MTRRRNKSLIVLLLAALQLAALPALAIDDANITVPVRGGLHNDFNRIVFDFKQTPKYKLESTAETTTLVFPTGVTLKPDALVGKLPRVKLDMTNAGSGTVLLRVTAGAKVSHFISGSSVVVDVRGAPVTESVPAKAIPVPTPAQSQTPAAAPVTPVVPAPIAPAAPLATAPTTPAASALPAAANVASPPTLVLPDLTSTPQLFAQFDPKISTPAVVYARGDYMYVAFDRRLRFELSQLFTPTTQGKAEVLPISGFSAYRLPLAANGRPLVSKTDTKWTIDMVAVTEAATSSLITQGLRARLEPEFSLGARVVVPLRGAGQILSLTDPVIGDALFLIPTTNIEDHIAEPRRFADFELLPTFQGIVIRALNDALAVRLVEEGVEISAPTGLRLSPPLVVSAEQRETIRQPREDVIPLTRWRQAELGTFTEGRQVLQQRIVEAIPSLRDRARLDLARYFAAYAYGPEARSLLTLVTEKSPDVAGRPEFLVLSGVADILSRNPAAGLRALEDSKLSDRDDVRLWRAVAFAEQRAFNDAAADFGATLLLLEDYPQPFFQRFALLAAESFIATGDDENAARILDVISKRLGARADGIPAIQYLQGVVQARGGSLDVARKLWTKANNSTDYLSRARAELALVDMDVAAGKTNLADAVRRLEGLRYAWRGDELELEILSRLAEYQLKQKKPMDSLDTYERAKVIFPDSPRQQEIFQQQQKIFRDVFLGEFQGQFTPLQLLTIYDRFKTLAPSDPTDAIKIIDRVVDEMLAIDLLPQAAALLEDRLKKEADVGAKNILSLRLAAVYLLNRQPENAQKLLRGLDGSVLTPQQAEESKLMQARAASDLGQFNDAFALLEGDSGSDAQRLLASTAWRAKDWPRAAATLGAVVPAVNEAGLKADEVPLVLARAVALTLANDRAGIDKLSADFGPAMAKTPQAQAFALLTRSDQTSGAASLARVREQVSDVDLFQGFLENYRKGAGN